MLQAVLSWDVVQSPVYANNAKCEGYQAITRSDTGALLNIARKSYTPASNQKLTEIAGKLSAISDFPVAGYDTFNGGRKVLAYLENFERAKVADFPMQDYLVTGNSHDYSTGFFIGTSTVMIRCQNQFSRISQQMKVHHTRHAHSRIEELVSYFENYVSERNSLYRRMESFAQVEIDRQIMEALVHRLLRIDEKAETGPVSISTRKANIKAAVELSIIRECSDIGSNLLGLFNGITHYTTHVKKKQETVFGSVLGSSAAMNEQAFKFCESLL